MPPKSVQDWLKEESKRRHSLAIKYIEENVDLIDTDLQKFMDDCPRSCQLEVFEMLLKAGIDMKDYVFNDSLKKWDMYTHDSNHHLSQYYTIDYKEEIDDYIRDALTWKTDWRRDAIVLDTIPAIEEA